MITANPKPVPLRELECHCGFGAALLLDRYLDRMRYWAPSIPLVASVAFIMLLQLRVSYSLPRSVLRD